MAEAQVIEEGTAPTPHRRFVMEALRFYCAHRLGLPPETFEGGLMVEIDGLEICVSKVGWIVCDPEDIGGANG